MSEFAKKLPIQDGLRISDSATRAMLENSPINILYADRDFNIVYVNPKSLETLKTVEQHLPVPLNKVLGSSIDVFHKNPAHQRRMLADDRNLPHRAIIPLGPEKLDLLVSPIYDEARQFIGSMVTWDVVTKRIDNENNLARIQSMMESAPINILMCDLNFNLIYINPASKKTLKTLEKLLPKPVEQLMGASIDIFHKNPEHQRRILSDERNLPHRAKIKLGPETLDLLVSAIFDANKKYLGPMVTWECVTDRVTLIENISEAAKHLSSSAMELNATASQMSQNAAKTATEAATAASSSEQVSQGVRTVATNTEEMTASIKEIARNAKDASNAANMTVKQSEATNATITKLGVSSQEIGNVVKVISSIAQQTNLLALNATIEAARAGDAGRGFAVVANEVKELAKQTAKATEEITNKISAIQKDTNSAVEDIGTITTSIKNLNGIATSIAASVEEQQATTNEVARIIQESSKGVQEINDSVKTVSTASLETKTGASQLLDAGKSLSELASRLEALLKNIKA